MKPLWRAVAVGLACFVGTAALWFMGPHLSAPAALTLAALGALAIGWSMVRAPARVRGAPQGQTLPTPTTLSSEFPTVDPQASTPPRELEILRAVIDGMAEGVWITTEDGKVTQHNSSLKELLFTGGALVGHRPSELLPSAELQSAVDKACSEGVTASVEVTIEGLRPRILSVHVAPLARHLKGSAAVFVDVTDLRRLEKVRKDFVANVSHELRTPITAIRGYAETLKDGALADPLNAPKMVDIIHRQSERLSELVEDLLEISRLESREIRLSSIQVDVSESARLAAEAVRPKASARGVTVAVELPHGLKVAGDKRGVEQVLLNLLDNAVKYTRPNGHVWLTARPMAGTGDVELAVRDDGPGIEAKHLPRLFERFYRVDKGRSRELGGTGLGLSIVKHLVTAMQGEVQVESSPGKGSTFFVRLPTRVPEAPPPRDTEDGFVSAPE